MDENKVTVTKDEFIELVAEEVMEIANEREDGGLSIILSGGIITGFFAKALFGDSDTITITEDEYSEAITKSIIEFKKDDDNKKIATPIIMLALLIKAEIKDKLFSEERLQNERMAQVAKMLVGEDKEDN